MPLQDANPTPSFGGFGLSSRTLSGTPTTAGSYNVTYSVRDGGRPAQSASTSFTFTVAPEGIGLGSVSNKSGREGTPFSTTLSVATGGTPPYTYSISGQPPGLSLSSRTLSGTPTTAGSYNVTYSVRDRGSPAQTDSTSFTFTVDPADLVLGSVSSKSGTEGTSFSSTLSSATGGTPPYTYSISGQPPGLSLSGRTLSGTPTTPGSYNVTYSVRDRGSPAQTDSTSFTFTVDPADLVLGSVSSKSGTEGTSFSSTLSSATGGTPPYTYSISGQPPGLSLSGRTLSGTPTTPGSYNVTYSVRDRGSPAQTASRNFTFTVSPPPGPGFGSVSDKSGREGTPFSTTLSVATGGTPPYTYSISGQPPGLSLSGRVLRGTPTAAGSYNVTYSVRDSGSPAQSASTSFTFTVAPEGIGLGSVSDKSGREGTPFSATLSSATGGTPPYTYSISGEPPGLSLSGRVLRGTPTAAGSYNVTYSVEDSGSPAQSASTSFTFTVAPADLVLGSVSNKSGREGTSFSATLSSASGGTRPYTYSISGEPPGLSLSGRTLSGTPTTPGSYNVTYSVEDSGSPAQTDRVTFSFTVASDGGDPPPLAPAPGGLQVSSCTQTSMTVQWNAVPDAAGYQIERRTGSSGSWGNPVERTSTSATVSGLSRNTSYSFRVSAKGDGSRYSTSYGNASGSVSKSTGHADCSGPLPTVGAPQNVRIDLNHFFTNDRDVHLSWDRVEGATYYRVQHKEPGGNWEYAADTPGSTIARPGATVGHHVCNPATTYQFRIHARGDGTNYSEDFGDWSTPLSHIFQCDPDSVPYAPHPTNVRITSCMPSTFSTGRFVAELEWDAVEDANRYQIVQNDNRVSRWTSTSEISNTNLTVDLVANTTHYYRIAAKGDGDPYSTQFGHYSPTISKYSGDSDCTDDTEPPEPPEPPQPNNPPTFNEGVSTTRSVPENTAMDVDIGVAVAAEDADGDPLDYSIHSQDGTTNDAQAFAFDTGTGQISTKAGLNYEAKSSYRVIIRVSDGRGGRATISVTINVVNVDEPGVVTLSTSSPRVGTAVTASLDSDPDGSIVSTSLMWQWQRKESGPWRAIDSATAASYTPVSGDAGKDIRAAVVYRDAFGPGRTAFSPAATVSGDGTPPTPPTIYVSFGSATYTVDEGMSVSIEVKLSGEKTGLLTVPIQFSNSNFATGVTFSAGTTGASVPFRAPHDDDTDDDTVTVSFGTPLLGVQAGTPSNAVITIDDDDLPAPTGLGGNGNIVNGKVKVWWNSVDGATKYNLRYTLMDCGTPYRPHACSSEGVQEIPDIPSTNTFTSTLISAGDGQNDKLKLTKLYTIRVQAVGTLGRTSLWSDDVYGLYVTDDPPRLEGFIVPDQPVLDDTYYPRIASIPLYSYWLKHQGFIDHWFPYRYCIDSKPTDVTLSEVDVEEIFTRWNDALLQDWGVHLMYFEKEDDVSDDKCAPPKSKGTTMKFPTNAEQAILFGDNQAMEDARCSTTDPPYRACWRTHSYYETEYARMFGGSPDFRSMFWGTILLRESPALNGNHRDWNRDAVGIGSCRLIEHALAHEIGHALGLGANNNEFLESHGDDTEHSLISEYNDLSSPEHCGPLIWDVAAVMGNHQSREAE